MKPLYLLLTIIFLLITPSHTTTNTHQTITKPAPIVFPLPLAKDDTARISVFNTNAKVQIIYHTEQTHLGMVDIETCFVGENDCYLEVAAGDEGLKGTVVISVGAYEYSYEVLVNGEVVSRQENVVTSFANGQFLYNKMLSPGTYPLVVTYFSSTVPSIHLNFMQTKMSVFANTPNLINVTLDQILPFYKFHFEIDQKQNLTIFDKVFEVKVEMPNGMLMGCDGGNLWDVRRRVCWGDNQRGNEQEDKKENQQESQEEKKEVMEDYLLVHKVGNYPMFQVKERKKFFIKLTIIETMKWQQMLQGLTLTLFYSKTADPHQAFSNLTTSQLNSKYHSTKQQCQMKTAACTFSLKQLQPGIYSVMPVFLDASEANFVYLYERSDGERIVESFYSFLSSQSDDDRTYSQLGGIVQFATHTQAMTEISIESESKFLMMEYTILRRSKRLSQQGEYEIALAQIGMGEVYNHDVNRATIYAELEPDSTYLLAFSFFSFDKFYAKKVESKARKGEMITEKQEQQRSQVAKKSPVKDNTVNEEATEDQSNANLKSDKFLSKQTEIPQQTEEVQEFEYTETIWDMDDDFWADALVFGEQENGDDEDEKEDQNAYDDVEQGDKGQISDQSQDSNAEEEDQPDQYEADQEEQEQEEEEEYDDATPQQIISINSLYLEADTVQFTIKNGKFPHKKLAEPKLSINGQKPQYNSMMNVDLLIVGGVIGGLVLLVLVVLVIKKRRSPFNQSNKNKNQLVEEQHSSSIDVGASSIEIPQTSQTEA